MDDGRVIGINLKPEPLLKITHSGVCHSDVSIGTNYLGGCTYPIIPGHEMVGTVVEIGSKVTKVKIRYLKINKEAKHRILNSGDTLLVFIEVQTGTYFGEDDIVRIEDDYNRI